MSAQVPILAEPPPQVVLDYNQNERNLLSLVGGTGKNAYIYSYFTPLVKVGNVARVQCILCKKEGIEKIYSLSKNSMSGPVAHLHTKHLIFAEQKQANEYMQAQHKQGKGKMDFYSSDAVMFKKGIPLNIENC